jgi:hypothetical protein
VPAAEKQKTKHRMPLKNYYALWDFSGNVPENEEGFHIPTIWPPTPLSLRKDHERQGNEDAPIPNQEGVQTPEPRQMDNEHTESEVQEASQVRVSAVEEEASDKSFSKTPKMMKIQQLKW